MDGEVMDDSEGDDGPDHGFAADEGNCDSYRVSTSTEEGNVHDLSCACCITSKFVDIKPAEQGKNCKLNSDNVTNYDTLRCINDNLDIKGAGGVFMKIFQKLTF